MPSPLLVRALHLQHVQYIPAAKTMQICPSISVWQRAPQFSWVILGAACYREGNLENRRLPLPENGTSPSSL